VAHRAGEVVVEPLAPTDDAPADADADGAEGDPPADVDARDRGVSTPDTRPKGTPP
jgi:hypothetical protein